MNRQVVGWVVPPDHHQTEGEGESLVKMGVWTKATKSSNAGSCVEVQPSSDGHYQVRDSKDQGGPVLTFTTSEWDAFLDGAKRGEFDIQPV